MYPFSGSSWKKLKDAHWMSRGLRRNGWVVNVTACLPPQHGVCPESLRVLHLVLMRWRDTQGPFLMQERDGHVHKDPVRGSWRKATKWWTFVTAATGIYHVRDILEGVIGWDPPPAHTQGRTPGVRTEPFSEPTEESRFMCPWVIRDGSLSSRSGIYLSFCM